MLTLKDWNSLCQSVHFILHIHVKLVWKWLRKASSNENPKNTPSVTLSSGIKNQTIATNQTQQEVKGRLSILTVRGGKPTLGGGRHAFGLYCLHGNLDGGVGGTLGLNDQQEVVSMQEKVGIFKDIAKHVLDTFGFATQDWTCGLTVRFLRL